MITAKDATRLSLFGALPEECDQIDRVLVGIKEMATQRYRVFDTRNLGDFKDPNGVVKTELEHFGYTVSHVGAGATQYLVTW